MHHLINANLENTTLTSEELQKIIDQFDDDHLKQQAIFGICQYGGGSDESFIRANKEGLQLFALELLKSARDTDMILADKEKKVIPLVFNENWIDENSDTFIEYIEPIADKQKIKPKVEYKDTTADKLVPYGCGLIVITILIAIMIGLGTIFKWIF